jgi:signal transduction histidine kinase
MSLTAESARVSADVAQRKVVAAALLLFVLVGAAFTLMSWQREVARHEQALESLVVMGEAAINTYFATLEKSLDELGQRVLVHGLNADAWRLLAAHKLRYPEFDVVVVNRLDGENILTSAGPPRGANANFSKSPSFIDALAQLRKGERMVVSQPILGPVTKKWVTPLRVGVRDDTGILKFMVGAGLPLERTHAFWRDVPLPQGAGIGLIRDDFFIVARHPLPEQLGEKIYTTPFSGLLHDYLRQNNFPKAGIVRGTSAITEAATTIVFRRLQDFPLTFYVNCPADNLLRSWWAAAWPTYLLLLILCAGGGTIAYQIAARQAAWVREREARVAELETLAGELQASNRELAAAKSELEAFVYTISHDLRSPIRAIDGLSAMLEPRVADNSESAALLARVRGSAARMGVLLNSLLELCRYSMQELKREPISMTEKVNSVLDELAAERGAAAIEVGPLPDCRGDRVLLRQVWLNLLGNALKYSAGVPAPQIRVGYADGAYFVADNGAGFDAANADRLFKLFSRLHSERDFAGTGVGLAIVRRIVERHGGSVRAEGRAGGGARFVFTIPDARA